MKIVVCPDSFKGSLSALDSAKAVARGVRSARPEAEVVEIPLADGGEGTLDVLVRATGGELRSAQVHDPLTRPIEACYGILGDGKTAVVEMAAASGLGLLAESERNPTVTTTYGTGELLLAAAHSGTRRIVVGIGGSATNDGGAGALTALGARFLDSDDCDLPRGGAALAVLSRIDLSEFRFPVANVEVQVACDVTNPLCGPNGASMVFGPQKGATPEMAKRLDTALAIYSRVVKRDLGKDVVDLPGAGAAGGLGAGLAAFLNAELTSGIDLVLDAVGFDEALDGTDLVVTGEGKLDEQTASGKTIAGVLRRASSRGIPVIALCGSISGDLSAMHQRGLTAAYGIVRNGITPAHAIAHAAELLERLAAETAVRYLRRYR